MSCSADLPFVGRSAVVEATKEEKPQTVSLRLEFTHLSPFSKGDAAFFAAGGPR